MHFLPRPGPAGARVHEQKLPIKTYDPVNAQIAIVPTELLQGVRECNKPALMVG
jgi:hypothetical protein